MASCMSILYSTEYLSVGTFQEQRYSRISTRNLGLISVSVYGEKLHVSQQIGSDIFGAAFIDCSSNISKKAQSKFAQVCTESLIGFPVSKLIVGSSFSVRFAHKANREGRTDY